MDQIRIIIKSAQPEGQSRLSMVLTADGIVFVMCQIYSFFHKLCLYEIVYFKLVYSDLVF